MSPAHGGERERERKFCSLLFCFCQKQIYLNICQKILSFKWNWEEEEFEIENVASIHFESSTGDQFAQFNHGDSSTVFPRIRIQFPEQKKSCCFVFLIFDAAGEFWVQICQKQVCLSTVCFSNLDLGSNFWVNFNLFRSELCFKRPLWQ